MVKVRRTTIHYTDHRFAVSVSKQPRFSLAEADFLAVLRRLKAYQGTGAFAAALNRIGLQQRLGSQGIDFTKTHKLAGRIMVDALMSKYLDGIDFSRFQGEEFRDLENFINHHMDRSFVMVRLEAKSQRGRPLAGIIMVAEENNCYRINTMFYGQLGSDHQGFRR